MTAMTTAWIIIAIGGLLASLVGWYIIIFNPDISKRHIDIDKWT